MFARIIADRKEFQKASLEGHMEFLVQAAKTIIVLRHQTLNANLQLLEAKVKIAKKQ